MGDPTTILGLLVAALGGAAIGVERERSGHASGRNARFAGVRTFTLLGIVAGVAGLLARSGSIVLAAVLLLGPVALTVAAYVAASRRDVDATTETAAFVAIAAAALAGSGRTALASGITAVTVLLLVEKSWLHRAVGRIDPGELRAAARFGVMAVVVLPLLPTGPFGPLGGVRPRELWLLVLFFSGLSFAGYFARRLLGPEKGYPLTGALAGIVSSTNATLTFARLSRRDPASASTLSTGAMAACTVLFPRVLLAALVLDRRVALALLPYLVPALLVGAGTVMLWLRVPRPRDHRAPESDNPLQIWPALQMAALFQLVLFGVTIVRQWFGTGGLLASGAVLGLTDVDALTISMTRSAASGVSPEIAAQAITIGVLVNCLMKAAIAVGLGTGAFGRRTAAALAVMVAALAIPLIVWR